MNGPSGKARAAFRLDAMDRRLDLSDAQRSRLEVILNEGAEGHRAAIAECRPVLDGHCSSYLCLTWAVPSILVTSRLNALMND